MQPKIALTFVLSSTAVLAAPIRATGELSSTYAQLILADDGVEITADKLSIGDLFKVQSTVTSLILEKRVRGENNSPDGLEIRGRGLFDDLTSPVKSDLDDVGNEEDDERLSKLIGELEGKDINELISEGSKKLASAVPGVGP